MTARRRQFDPVRDLLDRSGVEWSASDGRRHLHLFVAGRLVAVIPKGRTADVGSAKRKLVADARRHLRELKTSADPTLEKEPRR